MPWIITCGLGSVGWGKKVTVIIIHLQTCCSSPNTSRACNKVYQQEFAKKGGGGRGWVGQIDIQRGTQTQITELKQRRRRRQLCTSITYISLPSLHDYDVKMPNFTFCGECEHKTTLFSFPELQYSTPEKTANIWRTERDRISAIKFEAARLHFVTDVFVAVAVVVAWFP